MEHKFIPDGAPWSTSTIRWRQCEVFSGKPGETHIKLHSHTHGPILIAQCRLHLCMPTVRSHWIFKVAALSLMLTCYHSYCSFYKSLQNRPNPTFYINCDWVMMRMCACCSLTMTSIHRVGQATLLQLYSKAIRCYNTKLHLQV